MAPLVRCSHCAKNFAVSRWDQLNGFLVPCPSCGIFNGRSWNIRAVALAGLFLHAIRLGTPVSIPPRTTALGALLHHVSRADGKTFQPMNVNFGLFEPLGGKVRKRLRGAAYAERALAQLGDWIRTASV